jgi:hypothetical protein
MTSAQGPDLCGVGRLWSARVDPGMARGRGEGVYKGRDIPRWLSDD